MALSGSRDFTLNRNQIVQEALENAGILGEGETPDSTLLNKTNRKLNTMIKAWVAKRVGLWVRREAVLFLADSTANYSLSSASGSAHCTDSYKSTTIAANEAAEQTILSLTSTTGMTASDNIGIELDGGTRQWTTILSVDSSTQVTVAAALTAAASSGNTVVTYTSRINRPLRIVHARRYHLVDDYDVELELLSHEDYFSISKKSTESDPTSLHYDKQLSAGVAYVYPEPDGVKNVIKFTYQDMLQDFDSATDNADFPDEWLEAIIDGLSYRSALSRGQLDTIAALKAQADESFSVASNFDMDDSSIMFSPGSRC